VPAPELVVVIPAFNEAGRIEATLEEWGRTLAALGVDYLLRVYDDGSTDATPERLAAVAAERPRIEVRRHPNRGHGPTVLRGYREAESEWVAQADGDGEIPAAAFGALWELRRGHDLVLGARRGRTQGLARRAVSRIAARTVRALAGAGAADAGAADVNVPFRLMRRRRFAPLFAALPESLFAPNVALTALALRGGFAVAEVPVPFVALRSDAGTLVSGRLARGAARAFVETIRVMLRGAPDA
jgi:glycosyltransferase involved in cell wall biosynthesis